MAVTGINNASRVNQHGGDSAERRLGGWRLLSAGLAVLLLLTAAGCGSGASDSATPLKADKPLQLGDAAPESFAPGAPTQAELEAKLMNELARLGIDPQNPPVKAPSGEISGVARYRWGPYWNESVQGENLYGFVLVWEEQLAGDYDGNGRVDISDLSPIGMYFGQEAVYIEPDEVNGIAHWPHWETADNGLDGILNHFICRADGDNNGIVSIADIVPIALNFGARLDSYRVYRRNPGEADFTLQPNALDPQADYTVKRLNFIPGDPQGEARFEASGLNFSWDSRLPAYGIETALTAEGETQFLLVPYDSASGLEGQSSQIISFHSNRQPVLVASVSTREAEVPTVLDVDASQSTDPDGHSLTMFASINGGPPVEMTDGRLSTLLLEQGAVEVVVTVRDTFGGQVEQVFSLDLPFNGQRSSDWAFTELSSANAVMSGIFPTRSLALLDGRPALAYAGQKDGQAKVWFLAANDSLGQTWGESVEVGQFDMECPCVRLAVSGGQPAVCYVDVTGLLGSRTMFTASADSGQSFAVPELVSPSFSIIVGMAELPDGPQIAATGSAYSSVVFRRADPPSSDGWPDTPLTGSGVYSWIARHEDDAVVLSGPGDTMRLSRWSEQTDLWEPLAEFEQADQEVDIALNAGLLGVAAKANESEGLSFLSADLADPVPQLLRQEVYSAPPFRETGLPSLAFVGGRPAISVTLSSVGELHIIAAADERGENWLAPEAVDSSGNAIGFAPLIDMDGQPALVYFDKEANCLVFARRSSPL